MRPPPTCWAQSWVVLPQHPCPGFHQIVFLPPLSLGLRHSCFWLWALPLGTTGLLFETPATRLCGEPPVLLPGELELLAGEVPARSPGAFDMSGVGGSLAEAVGSPPPAAAPTPTPPTRKTPESFLGPNAALVDLDSLVSRPGPTPPGAKASNPFLPSGECGL